MKIRLTSYTFDASAQTVTAGQFSDVGLEGIQLITNVTDGIVIYQFNSATKGGSLSTDTLTLDYDTTSMDDADKLMVIVDDGSATQPVSNSSLTTLGTAVQNLDATIDSTDPSVVMNLAQRLDSANDSVSAVQSGTWNIGTVTTLTGITNWGNIVDNAAFTDGTTRLMPSGYIFDEVAGTALTENDAAAARIDSKRAQISTIEDATTRGQRMAVTTRGSTLAEGPTAADAAIAAPPVTVGGRASAAVPTAMSADGDVVNAWLDRSGRQVVTQKAATPTQSSVAGSASSVTLLALNTSRLGATVYNDSTAVLSLKLGATASSSSFTAKLQPDAYYEVPFGYTGVIDGIWASATGNARVTELT